MNENAALDSLADAVATLLRHRIGLRPEPTLRGRLIRCIRDETAAQRIALDAYLGELEANPELLQALLNRVTVQETSFFRHPQQFEVLTREILPNLSGPITIWSAGCANGQEAFSLAMVLEEQGIAGTVVATDLSTDALHRMTNARYTERELTGLSPARREQHLRQVGRAWEISPAVRSRVQVVRHNLLDDPPRQVRACQLVFCRNVLIYFSPEHARDFLDRLADLLPDATLFLGSAETIWSLTDRYESIRYAESFGYRARSVRQAATRMPSTPSPANERTSSAQMAVGRLRRLSPPPARAARPGVPAARDELDFAASAARQGRQALEAGDHRTAVVCFRKWAYLLPEDALAHLNLGLALEAIGDSSSAQRAFGAARGIATVSDHDPIGRGAESIARADLLKLLDSKQRFISR